MRKIGILAASAAIVCGAASAHAESWDYADAGTLNPAAYSFTATLSGMLTAYFMPSTGAYRSALGAKVNGTIIGSGVLPMGSTDNFSYFDFGQVSAGDSIEFFIDVSDRDSGATLGRYFSTASDNADGLQHIWAAQHPDQWYLGPRGVPEGTFIGFEDTTTGDGRGDLNYRDYTFVVPNLTVGTPRFDPAPPAPPEHAGPGPVPEPASWLMMIGGFGIVGAALRRHRRTLAGSRPTPEL
jgi:hypothetical protein